MKNSSSLLPIKFDFQGRELRAIEQNQAALFVIKDVCTALGIQNHKDAASQLEKDEIAKVGITDLSASSRKTVTVSCVTEPGLYRLVFKSRKAAAKEFQRWIYHEVIPQIRKAGSYSPSTNARPLPSQRVLELIAAGVSPRGAEQLVLADMGESAEISEGRMIARMENPMERAEAIADLRKAGKTIPEIIEEVGCSRALAYAHLALLRLNAIGREAVRSRQVSFHAGSILGSLPARKQAVVLKKIVRKKLTDRESVALIQSSR